MRHNQTRASDATFDLNLAPVLDIIVSIVPMLLLSVAFVQIKMIEAPTPQVVMEQKTNTPPKPETTITLKISKTAGFIFKVLDPSGKSTETAVQNRAGVLDFEGLLAAAVKIKDLHPEISKLQLEPETDVSFDDLVQTMDQVRMKPKSQTEKPLSISEAASAKPVEANYLFPDVIFSNVGG